MTDPATAQRIARLEEIAARDVGGRGIAPLAAAARGDLLGAARSIAGHSAPHVAILTGFFIPAAEPPAAENDGPIGAAHLAAALQRARVPVRLVTDEPCSGAVTAAARAAGVDAIDAIHDVIETDGGGVGEVLAAWESMRPPVSHVVAIERVGPSADGTCRNMKGDDISDWTAPLDGLFQPTAARVRIGIGDGGNELGMGKLPRRLVSESVPRGELTGCVTDCEHLLVCGVSNWGALALVAALALLRKDWRRSLLAGLDAATDLRVVETTMREGPAVDGMKRRPALSVDNLPPEVHAEILQDLLAVVG